MPQTGYTPIQLYRTSTASAAPSAGNLNSGELAINDNDGKLFYKDSGGVVQRIGIKDAIGLAGADEQLSRYMLKDTGLVFLDKGNSGTSTQTLDYTAGSHQKITATGNHTIATSNWPPTGNTGVILLEAVNFGAYTITWPTINWVKPDGSTTTSASTWLAAMTGRTAFQSSGTDFIKLWTRDAGTTIYGGFAQ